MYFCATDNKNKESGTGGIMQNAYSTNGNNIVEFTTSKSAEKLADESPRLREHVPDGEERRSNQDVADGTRDFLPIVFDVEVPDVNVIGNQLPQDDGKVVAQPPVKEQQVRPQQAQQPEDAGRHHPFRPLGQYPLEQQPSREADLR